MGEPKPVWFGMKVTPEQKRKIKHLAEREGTSAKEVVMRLVERALGDEYSMSAENSFLSGIEHLIGSVDGPADLSTNPKYLEGFGG
jgi:hypothetical protein